MYFNSIISINIQNINSQNTNYKIQNIRLKTKYLACCLPLTHFGDGDVKRLIVKHAQNLRVINIYCLCIIDISFLFL